MISAIIIIAALVTLVFICYPLVRPGSIQWEREVTARERRRRVLLSRKDEALRAVKDLDFDYQSGKLTDQDYTELRSRYRREAIAALKALDALDGRTRPVREARPGDQAGQPEEALEKQLEAEINQVRRRRKAALKKGDRSLFCPYCGARCVRSDNFCAGCGRSLAGAKQQQIRGQA